MTELISSDHAVAGVLLFGSVLLSIAFFVYGLNTLHLTIRSKRYRGFPSPPLSDRPSVAIHLPIYNELYVVGRLIDSCVSVARRYGLSKVRIYMIDDSNDETSTEIDRIVSSYSAQGIRFRTIRRGSREGFKAGALQSALSVTDEKYVAIFDADFSPPTDFLDRTVSILEHDAAVGFVQARWSHLDRNHNLITRCLAIGVDAHFFLEQQGRNGSGYLMNFNGSAGVLRTDAIRKSGGWAADTLAEDLDLSYRMQLNGYKGLYLNDLGVPGELPPTITSVKRQQGRWARGSLQTFKKLVSRIRSSDALSISQKVQAGIHLTYYLVHPMMVASFLLALTADFLSVNVISYAVNISLTVPFSKTINPATITFQVVPWLVFSTLIILSTLAVLLYCIQAVRVQKLGLLENLKQIILLVFLGYGISISNSAQAVVGLFSRETGAFARTPKYAIEKPGQTWKGKRYQIPVNRTTFFEAAAVGLAVLACINAVQTANFGIIPILLVYLTGYAFVLCLTLRQTLGLVGSWDS